MSRYYVFLAALVQESKRKCDYVLIYAPAMTANMQIWGISEPFCAIAQKGSGQMAVFQSPHRCLTPSIVGL